VSDPTRKIERAANAIGALAGLALALGKLGKAVRRLPLVQRIAANMARRRAAREASK
jgi:hypothetical protein